MIIQKHFIVGEHELVRTYSDRGVKIHGGIRSTGVAVYNNLADLVHIYVEVYEG